MARSVGEGIDNLVHVDLRGYGLPSILKQAGQALAGGPMYMQAARRLNERLKPGDPVFITTGFVFAPYNKGELDGLVGACAIARALDVALGAKPILVTEPELVEAVQRVCVAAGLNAYGSVEEARPLGHAVAVLPFTKDEAVAPLEARRLLDAVQPAAILSIERPGRNTAGVYHMGNGTDVSALAAKIDHLFEAAAAGGALTLAIGDLGNELGLGSLSETVRRRVPWGAHCQCPCGQGLAAAVEAEVVMTAAISDWGAYALAAALAYVSGNLEALHSPETEVHMLQTAVAAGLIDGSGFAIPAVDGATADYNARLVAMLRDLLAYPTRTRQRFAPMFERIIAAGALEK